MKLIIVSMNIAEINQPSSSVKTCNPQKTTFSIPYLATFALLCKDTLQFHINIYFIKEMSLQVSCELHFKVASCTTMQPTKNNLVSRKKVPTFFITFFFFS